jgi:hypothetical protein
MDEEAVRERAQAFSDAVVAGDIELATKDFSDQLRRNLGEVLSLLPLPSNEATVDSVAHGGSGYNAVIRLAGEIDEVVIQTRWKDRDGHPTMVELSHLSRTATVVPAGEGDGETETEDDAAS